MPKKSKSELYKELARSGGSTQDFRDLYYKLKEKEGVLKIMPTDDLMEEILSRYDEKKDGGRIGYQEGGGITNIINSDLRSPEEAFTQPLSTAVKAYGNYYGIGQPITSFDQFTQAEQNVIMDSIRQTVNNPNLYSYTATNIPMSDYLNTFNPSDLPEASKRGISGSGYNSFLDQLKDMSAAIKGDPAANVRMTLGRFNTNINPTNLSGGITDKYNFAQGTLGWTGATPYDISFSLPQNFVQEIVNNPNYQATTKYDDQGRKLVSESMVNNIFNNETYNGEQLKAAFGDNVSFVSDDYYNSAPNFNADVLREEEDAQYNLPKTSGIINSFLNMKDAVPQMLLGAATKIPGAGLVLGGLNSLGNFLGNTFENRQLTGDGVIVDEFGRSYNADELNAQNALGGYYTEAARSSRRRDSSIRNMLARQAAGKTISETRLSALQEQAAREEAARQAATAALAAQNASTYGTSGATGGYQSSWGGVDSFMSGSGTAADMGSFANGGLATMFRRK